MQGEELEVDKRRVRAAFGRAAGSYDQVTVLQREVGRRVLDRLGLVRVQPDSILDLGAGTGHGMAALARQYRRSRLTAMDIATPMLHQARRRAPWFRRIGFASGDAERLPLADGSFDLVHSNLMLQWCANLDAALCEMLRVLRPGGLLMFTTFGPDTLRELRASWQAVDGHSHVNLFVDMHDIGDALLRAGYSEPVMDVETFTLTYDDVYGVMRDLKQMGAGNATRGRARNLTGKGRMLTMVAAYEGWRREQRLPATFEVVYGHAWAPRAESRPSERAARSVSVAELAGRHRP